MTSLHYILIALGVGLVAMLMLYNHFQERRYRKQVDRIFSMQRNEVSLEIAPFADALPESRIEPNLEELSDEDPEAARPVPGEALSPPTESPRWRLVDATEIPEPAAPADAVAMTEPYRGRADAAGPAAWPASEPIVAGMAAAALQVEPESPLDAEIEYVARLRYARPTPLLFAPLMENLRRISKPIRVVGRREDGGWESFQADAVRTHDTVELSLLLADRSGPVSEVQLDTFRNRLYEFVAEYGGAVSCPDKAAALARARALDGFCAEVDMLIGLNVMAAAGAAFPTETIHLIAERAGLVQGIDGTYSLRDPSGHILFTLVNQEDSAFPPHGVGARTRAIALLFDVPRVGHGSQAFDRMTALGFELAEELGGILVDDGGRPVSHASLDKDRQRLVELYARMEAQGIAAGSERALRLFA